METGYFIYFRQDLTEYITQKFATSYNVNLDYWLRPEGYYSQKTEVADRMIPDGTYVMMGVVEYSDKLSYHRIGQFVGLKCTGIHWEFSHKFNPYPGSGVQDLDPILALVKVGKPRDFKKVGLIIEEEKKKTVTERELARMVSQYNPNSVESRVYRLLLALQRQIST